ncbi:MAG TPA: precorrin-6y C5,15-methyltransferase (decarboxylating) subunit CbiE [Solirubrobacterales bacterium]|nr:precorrin-6y C5,15-methyltransferase (decarboxylating) subunit CbiE [Solirubrobacterales bacterium]
MSAPATLTVVGIGADGWAGLGEPARAALAAAELIVGSARQLELLPPGEAELRPWPSPLEPLLEQLAAGVERPTCVLASGDPMLHGVGASLARRAPGATMTVHPHPSALAYACARLGWPAAEVELVSAVGRPADVLARDLQPGRRIVAYASGEDGAASLAAVACAHGYGPSRFVVLEQLGGPGEQIHESTAEEWGTGQADPLHAVAIECRPQPGAPLHPRTPGLPDDAFETDGQLTKRPVRALALAALAPSPRQLLWDVGAGSGSIGIEWLRAEPSAEAVAIEPRPERAQRAAANATRLGVPRLRVVEGSAPEALADLDPPDAVFVGGGVAEPGLLDRCWEALRPGGRLVADAVTLEGEAALIAAQAAHGGELTRLEIASAEPLGSFTGWVPRRPIVQWAARKEDS